MNIIFMGTPDFALPCLEALAESGHTVRAVFTQPDRPRGRRGNKLVPTPVGELAEKLGIPVYKPASLKKGEDAEMSMNVIREISPDIIIVVASGKILPKEVLEAPEHGCVNIHASLLPAYRGAAPIQRCVLNGEKTTGVTSMQMAEGLDTGDMLLSVSTEIGEDETSAELSDRLSHMGAKLLLDTLDAIEKGTVLPVKQDDSLSCYAEMISKDMCPLDFTMTAEEIHRRICGLSDSPCALAYIGSKRLKIYHSHISDIKSSAPAGTVEDIKKFAVVCGDGCCIELTEVQPEGGKRMNGSDFLRGSHAEKGARLTSSPAEDNS